jgi:hypothetical protein
MTTLLDFARQPTAIAEAAPTPAQQQPDPEPFAAGQTYTLTWRDVYRASKRNGTWFLVNLNRSWETPEARVFVGYVLKDDVMHWGEYVQDHQNLQASHWQVRLRPTTYRPEHFRLCEIETITIELNE